MYLQKYNCCKYIVIATKHKHDFNNHNRMLKFNGYSERVQGFAWNPHAPSSKANSHTFINVNPLSRNPWSAPVVKHSFHVFYVKHLRPMNSINSGRQILKARL